MLPTDLLAGCLVLFAAVSVGIVVHELAHAAVLRAAGVDFEIQWLSGGAGSRLGAGVTGAWASVRMRRVPAGLPAWQLRLASLAPLTMVVPLVAVAAGVVPDPFAGDDLRFQLAVIGWLACALPSPRDFSLVWYADRVIQDEGV